VRRDLFEAIRPEGTPVKTHPGKTPPPRRNTHLLCR
jgi:hypothetical protein